MIKCRHQIVDCLNHYEYFRKYLCAECGGIYICECELELAKAFLPHQLSFTQEYGTRKRFKVNGFAPRLCAECRGESEKPYPRAAIWGLKGKVERFYWREIFKTECEFALHWLRDQGETVQDINEFQSRFPVIYKEIRKKAKQHWQKIHKENPKYNLTERTEASFLSIIDVPIIEVEAPYVKVEKGKQHIGKWISTTGRQVSAEEFAGEWYKDQNFRVFHCERTLISTWVGTFLVNIIQDPSDPQQREFMRRSTREWRSDHRDTPLISFLLPQDFGTPDYFERRRDKFESAFKQMKKATNLIDFFEKLLEPSLLLRDYLWVNEDKAIETAHEALSIIPKETVVDSIHWAIQDFWNRQSGWPDLLIYCDTEYRFVEVKSPNDRLSQEQMDWFEWAVSNSKISCELFRIKRAKKKYSKTNSADVKNPAIE